LILSVSLPHRTARSLQVALEFVGNFVPRSLSLRM